MCIAPHAFSKVMCIIRPRQSMSYPHSACPREGGGCGVGIHEVPAPSFPRRRESMCIAPHAFSKVMCIIRPRQSMSYHEVPAPSFPRRRESMCIAPPLG